MRASRRGILATLSVRSAPRATLLAISLLLSCARRVGTSPRASPVQHRAKSTPQQMEPVRHAGPDGVTTSADDRCRAISTLVSADPKLRQNATETLAERNQDCWEALRIAGRRGETAAERDAAKRLLRELVTAAGLRGLSARHVKMRTADREATWRLAAWSDLVPYICAFSYEDRYPRSTVIDVRTASDVSLDERGPKYRRQTAANSEDSAVTAFSIGVIQGRWCWPRT